MENLHVDTVASRVNFGKKKKGKAKVILKSEIWVVTHHQYGISALVVQTSFHMETRGGVAKCWLFSQARFIGAWFNTKIFFYYFQMKKVYPDMNIKLPGKRRLGNNFDPGTYFLLKPYKMKYFGEEMREIQK